MGEPASEVQPCVLALLKSTEPSSETPACQASRASSILAGIVAAYGTFAIVAAVVGAIANGADADTEFRTNDWTGSGATALLISAATLFVAFLFGGYIAGRMARRRGVAHGIARLRGQHRRRRRRRWTCADLHR